VFAGHIQKKYPHVYNQGVWLFGSWDTDYALAVSTHKVRGSGSIVIEKKFSRK
jgi:hypothetical protein